MNNGFEQQSLLPRVKQQIWRIPRKVRIIFSILIFTVLAIMLMNALKPQAQKRAVPETIVKVEVVTATISDYPIVVTANGTVQADTRGNLVAQIRGEIVHVADNFKSGSSFNKGDVLVRIDDRDYRADLSRALASLSQAKVAYQQEQQNAKQAAKDWARLGNSEPAPDLVMRKPQLAAARAQLDSAKANYQTAQLNLSRTKITAPYTGRVLSRRASLGQYVSVGSVMAEIFATDNVEVSLPLSQTEYIQLGLEDAQAMMGFPVSITAKIAGNEFSWDAKLTRTDSTFDLATRQINVIASVLEPFSEDKPALKLGQFVSAKIQGRTVEKVFVIPNKSVREGRYVYTVKDQHLQKTEIDTIWQDDQNALIDSGLNEGDLIVTTSLNSTLTGAKVKLVGQENEQDQALADKDESPDKAKLSEEDK